MSYNIKEFDIKSSEKKDWEKLAELLNIVFGECFPEWEDKDADYFSKEIKSLSPIFNPKMLTVSLDDSIIGLAKGFFWKTSDDYKNVVSLEIHVHPEHRRKGLGKRLLKTMLKTAIEQKKQFLNMDTYSTVAAGTRFMNSIGAKKGIENHFNRLDLEKSDGKMLRNWIETGKKLSDRFEIGYWINSHPEEYIEEFVDLWNVMNTAPTGDLECAGVSMNSNEQRDIDTFLRETGQTLYTCWIRDKSNGKLTGFTELQIKPDDPKVAYQWCTGVRPAYRGKGFGKWLKADILLKIKKEHPTIRTIQTKNADSNGPMMKINNDLGFYPYVANTTWQIGVSELKSYFKEKWFSQCLLKCF